MILIIHDTNNLWSSNFDRDHINNSRSLWKIFIFYRELFEHTVQCEYKQVDNNSVNMLGINPLWLRNLFTKVDEVHYSRMWLLSVYCLISTYPFFSTYHDNGFSYGLIRLRDTARGVAFWNNWPLNSSPVEVCLALKAPRLRNQRSYLPSQCNCARVVLTRKGLR